MNTPDKLIFFEKRSTIPTFFGVKSIMFFFCHNLKVVWTIVGLTFINMMSYLILLKRSSYLKLKNQISNFYVTRFICSMVRRYLYKHITTTHKNRNNILHSFYPKVFSLTAMRTKFNIFSIGINFKHFFTKSAIVRNSFLRFIPVVFFNSINAFFRRLASFNKLSFFIPHYYIIT